MARTLVKALEGLSFPCDRARIVEYASRNDIAPRALDFLQRLPEQQYASMAELFTALPSKGSLRKPRPRLIVVETPEYLPADNAALHEEPAVQRAQEDQSQPNETVEAAAEDEDEDEVQDLGEEFGQEQEAEPQDKPQGSQPDEPTAAPEQAAQVQRSEPVRTPTGGQGQGQNWRPPNLRAAVTRLDPFGVTDQWQRLWLDWYSKSAESYTRLFMPWLRR